MSRFGLQHHELLLRQLFQIRHIGTVDEYIEQFSSIVDQLGAYHKTTDPLFYTARFIDGLKDHIKAAVHLHRPPNWNTACVLAKLQEDMVASRKPEARKWDAATGGRPFTHTAPPLPPPLLRPDKPGGPAEPRPAIDAGRALSADEHWAALRSSRRAQGLCIRCGAKWSRDHRCAQVVQLHALEEVLAIFSDEEAPADPMQVDDAELAVIQVSLSATAISGKPAPRTMCFEGQLGELPIHILLDSGSTHSFVSSTVAAKCSGVQTLYPSLRVQVANGQQVVCSQHLPDAQWAIQGVQFHSDLKVLPLSSYDLILGMDWLSIHSPMNVHWAQHWLQIPYQQSTVLLQGLWVDLSVGSVLQLNLNENTPPDVISEWPVDIQDLVKHYATLFDPPTELPPPRSYDHAIPLLPGASPVFTRPYRFSPAIKDEIEKQVHEMLQSGLIQKSSSPFSSPVLLVKKKDKTWRFCVDYHQLNAITLKSKYPVPLIDDLLDELGQARWFPKLDLRAGFHQILLQLGEEFKIAFQTHFGHFEFVVMPFGLTGAPGTFQEAMNSTLAPFLRKFVLVFFDDILIYSRTYEDHIKHISQVLRLLSENHWKLKLSKCAFAQQSISYLGHIISGDGVSTDPAKISAVVNWPTPASVKDVCSFLGLAGYYRKFVRHFGLLAKPLTTLLHKHTVFQWTSIHD